MLLADFGFDLVRIKIDLFLQVIIIYLRETLCLGHILILFVLAELAVGARSGLCLKNVLVDLVVDHALELVDDQLLLAFCGDSPELLDISLLHILKNFFVKNIIGHE